MEVNKSKNDSAVRKRIIKRIIFGIGYKSKFSTSQPFWVIEAPLLRLCVFLPSFVVGHGTAASGCAAVSCLLASDRSVQSLSSLPKGEINKNEGT